MRNVVTLDMRRRLITPIRTAMIPTPSAIVNQSAIVYPLIGVRPPAWLRSGRPGRSRRRDSRSIENPHAPGRARNRPVVDVGGKARFPWSCWGLREARSGRRRCRTAGDCATARTSSIGKQSVASADEIVACAVGYVSTASRPYLRSRPYNCVRVSPSRFAALDLLPRVSRITRRMV